MSRFQAMSDVPRRRKDWSGLCPVRVFMREQDVHVFHVCCDDNTTAAMSMKEATVLGVIGGATILAIVGFT
jgi:hypothetical protein